MAPRPAWRFLQSKGGIEPRLDVADSFDSKKFGLHGSELAEL